MAADVVSSLPSPGFNFSNCLRNSYLFSKGFPVPTARKTGTTICGITFKNGVILGADTRSTQGPIVANKYSTKIHFIAKNMYCCGAGTAADTAASTNMVSAQVELHRMATDRVVPVTAAVTLLSQHLFRYQGHVSAALVLGGVDSSGPSIYTIHPHGSYDKIVFGAMGSGSLAAMSVLEKGWKEDMSVEDGMQLVRNSIAAGVLNDLASGNNIDLCIITQEGSKMLRLYEQICLKGEILGSYTYKPGTTAILSSKVVPLEVTETVVKNVSEEMETE